MNTKGMTLIELLVVFAISALIAGMSYRIYIKQQREFYTYGTQNHLQLEVKNALDSVVEDLKSCRGQITYNQEDGSYTWPRFVSKGEGYAYDSIVPVKFFLASNEVFRDFNGKKTRVAHDITEFKLEPIKDKKTENAGVRVTLKAVKELNGIKENGVTKEVNAEVSTVVFLKQEYFKNAQKFWKIGKFDYNKYINIEGNFTFQQDAQDLVETVSQNIQNEPGLIVDRLKKKLEQINKNINNLVEKITDLEQRKKDLKKQLSDLHWWQKSAKKKIKKAIKEVQKAIDEAKKKKEELEQAKQDVEGQIAQVEGNSTSNSTSSSTSSSSSNSSSNSNNSEQNDDDGPGFVESAQNAAHEVGNQINNYQNADFDSL